MDDLTLRALADAPVSESRRRWRTRAVWLDALLVLLLFALGVVLAVAEIDAFVGVLVAALVGPAILLGMLLASDRVLSDWLLPEDERKGRAYFLNPLVAFTDCSRAAWIAWFGIVLTFWVVGGALVDSVVGALGGLGIGLLMSVACLLFGMVVGWLVIVPVGLVVTIAVRRNRSVQAVRLALLAAVLLAMVVLAAPIAWTSLGALPGWEGVVRYLKAVVGVPEHVSLAPGVLWTARSGLAVMVVALLPLVVLLGRLPQQQAAGRFYHRASRRDRLAP